MGWVIVTGTDVPDAVFLTPNEYQTINRIGRTKKKTYHRIDGIASENDGARSRRRRGGPADGRNATPVVTSPSTNVAAPMSRPGCGVRLVVDVDQAVLLWTDHLSAHRLHLLVAEEDHVAVLEFGLQLLQQLAHVLHAGVVAVEVEVLDRHFGNEDPVDPRVRGIRVGRSGGDAVVVHPQLRLRRAEAPHPFVEVAARVIDLRICGAGVTVPHHR